jgi:hypothetical protein
MATDKLVSGRLDAGLSIAGATQASSFICERSLRERLPELQPCLMLRRNRTRC